MRELAQVPEEFRHDEIRWLILDPDQRDTGGVFIFYHKELDDESEFDDWYENAEQAKADAAYRWGVSIISWIPADKH